MFMLLVVSGAIISLSMGMRQSMGVFLGPVTAELGISAAAFSFSLALQNIVWGISQPFIGALADRYGARRVVFATAVVYAAGLLVMALSRGALALDAAGLLIGLGIAGTGFGVLIGVVARASPPEKRSQRIGTVAATGSLGTVVLAPLGQSLSAHYGWQAGLLAFAAVAGAMMLLSFFIREAPLPAPAQAPQRIATALGEAARHRGFVQMTLAYFACGFQLI